MTKYFRFFLITVTSLIFTAAALTTMAAAQMLQPLALTAQDQADIVRVEEYLNQIHTLHARFQQYSSKGGITFGDIYIKRPGRMRVQYEAPSKVIMVADGSLVSFYDGETDQLNQVPLSETPAWFLVRDPISLTKDLTISRIDRSPGAMQITMYRTDEPEGGTVSMIFSDSPLELKQWIISDGKDRETRVGLFGASIGGDLNARLFDRPVRQTRKDRQDR